MPTAQITLTEFTPLASALGGALIGLAAVLLMLVKGRIMGATGIVTGIIAPTHREDLPWRIALVLGMISGPAVFWLIRGEMPEVQPFAGPIWWAISGVIVGMGVTWGAGCTSGHGVCGLARLSPRSLVATVTFMLFTGFTVWVIRHGMGA